ncbi:MAG: ribonuclease D [Candidatus Hydrogenedentota bacterium]
MTDEHQEQTQPAGIEPGLPPYEFINSSGEWGRCIEQMREAPRIAVDVESNSLFAYRETVCLIQLSIPGHDYILDPLAGFSIRALGDILANPAIEKVFHASEYDLILFKRIYDWDVVNLFDTMWAARVLGYTNMGLAGFLREFYGVEQRKRFQKANWARRPLSDGQLAYAQIDTHYLLRLRDDFAARLEATGRMAEAQELFAQATQVRQPTRTFDPEGFWALRGARDLKPAGLAVLRELFILRENEAKRRNQPPFKVLNNSALIAIAQATPTSLEALGAIPGVGNRTRDRLGTQILGAIKRGKKAPLPKPPKRPRRRTQSVTDRYMRLQQWRKEAAEARGVPSDVILSKDDMWVIAENKPGTLDDLGRISSLGPHRLVLHGEAILDQLD